MATLDGLEGIVKLEEKLLRPTSPWASAGIFAGAAALLLAAPLGPAAAAIMATLAAVSAMAALQPARARELWALALSAGTRSG